MANKKALEKLIFDKPMSLEDIAEYYGVTKRTIKRRIQKSPHNIVERPDFGREIYVVPGCTVEGGDSFIEVESGEPFGVCSDTHLGGKHAMVAELHEYYDELADRGIKTVFHAGDITDGLGIYRGHVNDLLVWGVDAMVEYTIENYPRHKDITTHFIMGNHDNRVFEREGVNLGEMISRRRDDLIYLGNIFSNVNLGDGINMHITHPGGGAAYTLGYQVQKYLRMGTPSSYPNILVMGHLHTSLFTRYHEVDVYQAGCFTDTTDFLRRKGITSTPSAWIVEMEKADGAGRLKKVRNELLEY